MGVSSHHRAGGGFRNPGPNAAPHGILGLLRWVLIERPRNPRQHQPPRGSFRRETPSFDTPRAGSSALTVSWIGHSSLLVQIGGRNVLLDPVWSERVSPISSIGPRRWMEPGIPFPSLPPIDIVLLSHNHYDHLDTATLRRVAAANPAADWVVPLGLIPIVRRCGATNIVELDWWQEHRVGNVTVGCAPAQHFSGRGPHDRDRTLWCSWALRTAEASFYFGADSGLHSEYRAIGERYGPFDLVALPIGAYEPRWFMKPVHMNPEDAIQAYQDLVSSTGNTPPLIPIHWGTFKLTDEPMDEPPKRTVAAWQQAGLPPESLWLLAHGETRRR
ncbi:MAG TPA: MBL fold metallo-hydrolase [Gemmatimonadaceae bacterium]|nr:MBL fold metallo-hydrolase [Gemmatimonadaceae bacterium]